MTFKIVPVNEEIIINFLPNLHIILNLDLSFVIKELNSYYKLFLNLSTIVSF
jgi:hypothetical protein